MARASIPTLLPIDSYAKIMGISPWEFNQISGGLPTATRGSCQSVWFQWQWQKDFVSREEIAQAISEAESAIAHQLGYWPAPAFVVDEHVSINRGAPMLPSVMGANAWGWWKNIPLRWSHWQAGGVFNRTIIQAAATVTLSDTDSDGVNDLFTITQAVTTTDPNEIAIYFQLTDRVGETSIGEQWRIRPIKVSISGGTATITGHPSQLVLPSKTEAVTAAELNISDPIFASEVDVYRVFTDTQHDSSYPYQGVALWDVPCNDGGDCGTTILPLCQAEARNDRVYANYGDPATWPYGCQPDRLQVNYLAGYPLLTKRKHAD